MVDTRLIVIVTKLLLLLSFESAFHETSMMRCTPTGPSSEREEHVPVLLWKSQFVDSLIASTILPVVGKNNVVVSRSADLDPPDEIISFNKTTGELAWKWSKYLSPQEMLLGDLAEIQVYEDHVVLNTHDGLYLVDMTSGQTTWHLSIQGARIGNHKLGSWIFVSTSDHANHYFNRIDLENKEICDVYSIPRQSGINSNIQSPLPVFDNTIVSTLNTYDFKTTEEKHIVYATSLSCNQQDPLRWETELDVVRFGVLGVRPPTASGDKIYVGGSNVVYCLDKSSGEVVWKNEEYGQGLAGMIIVDDKLVIGSAGSSPCIYALDLTTGSVLWTVPYGGNGHQLQHHNRVVYVVSGGDGLLHAIDVTTGAKLFELESPDYNKDRRLFFDNCSVDTETNRLYATNFKYILCYQLPQ